MLLIHVNYFRKGLITYSKDRESTSVVVYGKARSQKTVFISCKHNTITYTLSNCYRFTYTLINLHTRNYTQVITHSHMFVCTQTYTYIHRHLIACYYTESYTHVCNLKATSLRMRVHSIRHILTTFPLPVTSLLQRRVFAEGYWL